MKTWAIQVHKRQINTPSYGTNILLGTSSATEYEYVNADYFDILPTSNLILWNGDRHKLPLDENAAPIISWQNVDIIAAYHANQWLSIVEHITPKATNE